MGITRQDQIKALCALVRHTNGTAFSNESEDGWTYRCYDFPTLADRQLFTYAFGRSELYTNSSLDVGTGHGYYVYIEFELAPEARYYPTGTIESNSVWH